MTLMVLVVAVTAGAQVTYPWNPDSNADEFIGFTDILDLLAVYGSEFSPENIICNTDSSSAMVYLGDKNFVNCSNSCDSLGSIWHLPKTGEIISQHPNLIPIDTEAVNVVWMNLKERNAASGDIYDFPPYAIIQPNGYLTFMQNSISYPYAHPDELSTFSSITTCIEAKLAAGWYPMENFPSNRDRQGYAAGGASPTIISYLPQSHASFWRWAE